MNSLRVNGIKNIEGMEFHDIEGGFGEGKKALLVKEIANIHGRELKVINQAINMNKERFKEGIDIVDLKSVNWIDRDLLNDLGFSNSSIANANHIYSLSERGYSKLLKILEDDFAWEQYDKLVDGYFNMRNQLSSGQAPKEISAIDLFEAQVQAFKEVKQQINEVNHRVLEASAKSDKLEERMDNQTLSTAQTKKLKKLANSLAVPLVGGKGSKAYEPMIRKVYMDIYRQLFRELGVNASDEIKVKDFNFALEVMNDYKIATALKNEIDMLNNQRQLNI
ncbi:TPA: ORF6C domain-containing protein [Clostridium perfringens]